MGLEYITYTVTEAEGSVEVCIIVSTGCFVDFDFSVKFSAFSGSRRIGNKWNIRPSQLLRVFTLLLAAQQDRDFIPINETVTFSRNELRTCLEVTIIDDEVVELSKSFSISLERTENLDERITISPDRGTVTIEDDDGECNICN